MGVRGAVHYYRRFCDFPFLGEFFKGIIYILTTNLIELSQCSVSIDKLKKYLMDTAIITCKNNDKSSTCFHTINTIANIPLYQSI